jgi:hypothetical protein
LALKVSISYSIKDKYFVNTIFVNLETSGIQVWIVPRDIGPGEDCSTAIAFVIKKSCIMGQVCSINSNT